MRKLIITLFMTPLPALAGAHTLLETSARRGCEKIFKVFVGDRKYDGYGTSIPDGIQRFNKGLRRLGFRDKKNKEAYASEIPQLVKVMRKQHTQLISSCVSSNVDIASPCLPYGIGTEAFVACLEDRKPEFACYTFRGPWQFLSSLKPGVLTDDSKDIAKWVGDTFSAAPICSDGTQQ